MKNVFGISPGNCRTNRCRASGRPASLAHPHVFRWLSRWSRATVDYEESFQNPVLDPGSAICTVSFAADQPSCQKTGKNCPMNDGEGVQLRKELHLLVKLAFGFEFRNIDNVSERFPDENVRCSAARSRIDSPFVAMLLCGRRSSYLNSVYCFSLAPVSSFVPPIHIRPAAQRA